MLPHPTRILLAAATLAAVAAGPPAAAPPSVTVTIQNKLGLDRRAETISVPVARLGNLLRQISPSDLLVKDAQTGRVLVSQPIDNDGDGTVDALLFQTDIKANATQKFTLVDVKGGAAQQPQSPVTTYSRLVPERTDDYTWENERVAFRTYGPEAERLVVAKQPGGTLTSGMDCWLKHTPTSIIDKWYAANVKEVGYYHKDHGEGYDPYHVGDSRGFAGVGVWDRDSLYVAVAELGSTLLRKSATIR